MRPWVIVVIFGCFLIACAGTKQWTRGQRLYSAKCRSCHTLISPKKHSDEEWRVFVEKYKEKSNLTEEETREILKYLVESN